MAKEDRDAIAAQGGKEGVTLRIMDDDAPLIVWLPYTPLDPAAMEVQKKAETVPGHLGVCIRRKGFGIRVPEERYHEVQALLLGEQEAEKRDRSRGSRGR